VRQGGLAWVGWSGQGPVIMDFKGGWMQSPTAKLGIATDFGTSLIANGIGMDNALNDHTGVDTSNILRQTTFHHPTRDGTELTGRHSVMGVLNIRAL
jgi:hypothetical protein